MFRATITLIFALVCSSILALGQEGRGTIFGVVTDSAQAAVVGAQVSIINVDTNIELKTETNGAGYYTSPPLNVGQYKVIVEQHGFKRATQLGIVLQVDQHAEINVELAVGDVHQSVQVTGEAPLVNSENASVGEVISNKNVQNLPVNGRSAFALVLLSPDVHSNAGPVQSGFADRGTNLADISINGGPNSANNLLVDGMIASNSYYPDLNADLTVEAVQEFRVQSGPMSAEYGFTLGGVVNAATKSGTNDYHGSAYEFVRNDILTARNAFAESRPPFRYNQYGVSLGGPVKIPKLYNGHNKTFIFGNWEQYNYLNYIQQITSTPISAWRTGNFSQLYTSAGQVIQIYDPESTIVNPHGSGYVRTPFPGNIIPASRLDPVAQAVNNFYPLPNITPTNPFTFANNYESTESNHINMQQYTIRGDQHFSDSDSFFARYTYFQNYTDNGGSVPWPNPAAGYRYDYFTTRNTALGETHIFSPSLVNDFRLGAARQYFPFTTASANQNWPQQLGLPTSVPNLVLPAFSNGYTAFASGSLGLRAALTWDATDTVTIVLGPHSIKVGAEYRLLFGNNHQTSNPSGTFNFSATLTNNPQSPSGTGSTYADFLLGNVSSATIGTYLGESEKAYSMSGFIQDDWRVSRKLNLNLGLRYDFQEPPYERNCGTSNFNPNATNPLNGLKGEEQFACKGYGQSVLLPQYDNFAPRFGFAYDPTGNGHTVVRGGYAIFYPSTFNVLYFGSTSGFASTTTTYSPPGNNTNFPAFILNQGFPTPPIQPAGSRLGPSAFLGQAVTYDQPDQKTPMSQQWDFSIQKQLPGNWVIDASYSGNHGTHMIAGSYNLDQINPQYLSLGTALQNPVPNPYAGIVPGPLGASTITLQQSLLPLPYYSAVTVRNPHSGNSIYHAGLLTIHKRFSNGLTLLASYTKSKLIDDSIAAPINFGAVEQTGITGYQNVFNRSAERAVDPTDVPQRLAISAVYELPFGRGHKFDISNRLADAVFGGWQSQMIMTLQRGLPIAITGASNNLATRPNSTGQSARLSNPTAAEWFNTAVFVNPPLYTYGNLARTLPDVRGPGFFNVDFSLIKNIPIKERLALQVRGEAFNLDNHVNLLYPNTTFVAGPNGQNASGSFGTITGARDPRTVQLAMKLLF